MNWVDAIDTIRQQYAVLLTFWERYPDYLSLGSLWASIIALFFSFLFWKNSRKLRRSASTIEGLTVDRESRRFEASIRDERIRSLGVEISASSVEAMKLEHFAASMGVELSAKTTDLASTSATLIERTEALRVMVVDNGVLRQEKLELSSSNSTLKAELRNAEQAGLEKVELLSSIRVDMENRFKQIADETMKKHGEELSISNRERLEAALNPLKEHVGRFEVELRAVHEGAGKERQQLKTEIEQLTRRSEEVSREAVALTRALKGDKQRQGAWGEMILSTLLERSGLRSGVEYEMQAHRVSDEGTRYRPDVVVRMPGDKRLVIDSKVSLVDYEVAVNAEDDDLRAAARLRHVASLKRHIAMLSDKGYQTLEAGSVDYVVMFVPIEGALSEALREAGDLTSFALEKNVTISTPTTLMMALRTVSHVWAIERRNRNAEEIAKRAGLLYDKIVTFVDSMQSIGKNLGLAQKSYADAIDRLTRGGGNVLGQVEKLKTLGARASKSISIEFDGGNLLDEGVAGFAQEDADGFDGRGKPIA